MDHLEELTLYTRQNFCCKLEKVFSDCLSYSSGRLKPVIPTHVKYKVCSFIDRISLPAFDKATNFAMSKYLQK